MTNSGVKMAKVLAGLLKDYRKANHLTQDQMSDLLSVSQRQYRRYETDGIDSIDTWNLIAETLSLPILSIH